MATPDFLKGKPAPMKKVAVKQENPLVSSMKKAGVIAPVKKPVAKVDQRPAAKSDQKPPKAPPSWFEGHAFPDSGLGIENAAPIRMLGGMVPPPAPNAEPILAPQSTFSKGFDAAARPMPKESPQQFRVRDFKKPITDPEMDTMRAPMDLPAPAEFHPQTDSEIAASRRRDDTTHEYGMGVIDQLAPNLSAEERHVAKAFIISRLGGYSSGVLESQRDVMGGKLQGTEPSALNAAHEFLALHDSGKTDEIAKTINDFKKHRERGHTGRVLREEMANDPTATQSYLNEFNAGLERGQEQFENVLGGNAAERVVKNKDTNIFAKGFARVWSGLVTGTAQTLQMPADAILGDLPTMLNAEGDASANDRLGGAMNVALKGLGIAATATGVGQGVKMIGGKEVVKGVAKIAYELGPVQNPLGDPKILRSNTENAIRLVNSGTITSEELQKSAAALTKRLSPEDKSLAHLNAREIIQAANDAGADISVKDVLAASHINVALGKVGVKDGIHPLHQLDWEGKNRATVEAPEATKSAPVETPKAAQEAPINVPVATKPTPALKGYGGHLQDVVDRGPEAVKTEIKSLTDQINEGRKHSAELRSRASANRKLSSDWKKGGGKGFSGLEPASGLLAKANINDNHVQGLIKQRDLLRGTTTTLLERDAANAKKAELTPLPKAIKTNTSKPEYAYIGEGLGAERIHPVTNVDPRTLNALGVDYVGIVPGENYYLAGVKDGKVVRRFDSPDVAGIKKALSESTPKNPKPVTKPVKETPTATTPAKVSGKPNYARGNGEKYPVEWKIRELDDLNASHNHNDFTSNPDWKGLGQPRDRSRVEGKLQVKAMAQALDAEQLLESSNQVVHGSPIVDAKGNVEHGNGRTMAIKLASESHPEQYEAYRKALISEYPEAANFQKPVLVRERIPSGTAWDDAQIEKYTKIGTSGEGKGLSAAEVARSDAKTLPEHYWENFEHNGDSFIDSVNSPANHEKVVQFIKRQSGGDQSGMLTASGQFSTEGAKRIERAALFHLMGDSGMRNAEKILENGEIGARIMGGLKQALLPLLKVKTDRLSEIVNGALTEYTKFKEGKFKNNFEEYMAQGRMDAVDPDAIKLLGELQSAAGHGGSQAKVAEVFKALADDPAIRKAHSSINQDALFQKAEVDVKFWDKTLREAEAKGANLDNAFAGFGYSDAEKKYLLAHAGVKHQLKAEAKVTESLFGGEDTLFQPTSFGPKGQYQYDAATKRGLVTLFENADVTTILHETAHHYLRYLPNDDVSLFAASLKAVDKNGNPTDKPLIKNPEKALADMSKEDYHNVQEHYARMLEDTIYHGYKSPDPAVQAMFDRAAKRFKEVYGEAGIPAPSPFKKGGKLSQDETNDRLKAYHNTSIEGALEAARMGGIPQPSTAVVKAGDAFDSFGDVSFVAKKSVVDPEYHWANTLFDRDVYSQRQPKPIHTLDKKAIGKVIDDVVKGSGRKYYNGEIHQYLSYQYARGEGNFKTLLDKARSEDEFRLAYFNEKGIPLPEHGSITYSDFPNYKDFENWVQAKFEGVATNPRVKTRSGMEPYNITSVSDAMGTRVRGREVTMSHSLSKGAAKNAKAFSSVEDARAKIGNIDAEAFKKYKTDLDSTWERVVDKAGNINGFEGYDEVSKALQTLAKSKPTTSRAESLFKRFDLTKEGYAAAVEAAEKLRNAPTEYFEAKPTRPVRLDEFAGVVVPDDVPRKDIQKLRDAGLNVETYKAGDSADRLRAISAFDDQEGVLFQAPGEGSRWQDKNPEAADIFARMMNGEVTPEMAKAPRNPEAPRPEYGISNRSMEDSKNIDAPKGIGKSTAELASMTDKAAKSMTSEDAIRHGRGVASGELPLSAENVAKSNAGLGILEGRVDKAVAVLDKTEPGSTEFAHAKADLDLAQSQLQSFADDVQKGKSEWANIGRAYQQKVDATGSFARMTETIRRDQGGKPLTESQTKQIKDIEARHNEATAEIERLTKELDKIRAESAVTRMSRARNKPVDMTQRKSEAIKRIKELLGEDTSSDSLAGQILNQDPHEMDIDAAIRDLAKSHVHEGARGLDEVVSRIQKDLPKLDDQTIIDAIGQKGTPHTRSELAKALADLKTSARRESSEAKRAAVGKEAKKAQDRLNAINAKIKEYETRIVNKDFAPTTKPQVEKSKELINAEGKRSFASRRFQSMRSVAQKPGNPLMNAAKQVSGIFRYATLGADLGVMARQGQHALTNPKLYGEALKNMVQAMGKEERFHGVMHELDSKQIDGLDMAPIRRKAGLSLTDASFGHEEGFVSTIFSKVPIIGAPLERAQTAFLHTVRTGMFDGFYSAGKMSAEELKNRAELINSLTGRSNLKHVPELLQVVMTSPRLRASRYEILARPFKDALPAMRGDRGAQANLRQLAGHTASTAVILYAANRILKARNQDDGVTLDPTSSDFLKLRVGGRAYDLTAGMSTVTRNLYRMTLGIMRNDPGYAFKDAGRTLAGTLSPGITVPIEMKTGKSVQGYKDSSGLHPAWHMAPLIVQQAVQDVKEKQGAAVTAADVFAEFVGLSSQAYPRNKKPEQPGKKAAKTSFKYEY